jgi:hypothetical protein
VEENGRDGDGDSTGGDTGGSVRMVVRRSQGNEAMVTRAPVGKTIANFSPSGVEVSGGMGEEALLQERKIRRRRYFNGCASKHSFAALADHRPVCNNLGRAQHVG